MNESSAKGSLESIQLKSGPTPQPRPGILAPTWSPVVGREVQALLPRKGLSESEARRVEGETCRILSQCVSPTLRETQRTGLVVGYIQSGKTLSFTALTALARDNRYRLVIVLGGTTTNLVEQSLKRLADDLDIEGRGQRIWTLLLNPGPNSMDEVSRALRSWSEYADRPERCRTVLIVVMKHHAHLASLTALLKLCPLHDVSALVIDDEGDQAGLNTKVATNEESTTNSRIRTLREALPSHSYLLYTATPQAPLLISRIDMLSPQFADPIEPGPDYVGGAELFGKDSHESPFIEIIPNSEIPDDESNDVVPPSFENALRLFYVGVAAGLAGDTIGKNRSMMVHPSQRRDRQQVFLRWAQSIQKNWLTLLKDPSNSPDKRELIQSFLAAYDDLARTAHDLPSFDAIEKDLYYAIDQTEIRELNAREGRIPTIHWKRNYSYILVGGQGLDRGFTVEGLTVTYMSRGAGMGHADTVQQRGRFFGYKRPYLGLIRIFLEQSVAAAFRHYVQHEQSMRSSLVRNRDAGKSLQHWRRDFFLDRSMTPTRRSVLSLDYMYNRNLGREWIDPKMPHAQEVLERNRDIVDGFIQRHRPHFLRDSGSADRTEEQQHLCATFTLLQVYEELLVPLTALRGDLLDHIHMSLQIQRALDNHPSDKPPLLSSVYLMSGGAPRVRTVDSEGFIKALFQGSNERTGYPGDREIRHPGQVTVQIHKLTVRSESPERKRGGGNILADDVPAVAVSIPEPLRGDSVLEQEHE